MRTKIKYAPVIAAISVGLAAGTLTMAPAASAQEWFTDAETCAEIGLLPHEPAQYRSYDQYSDGPGATIERPIRCDLPRPAVLAEVPTDGTPVQVTSGLGIVDIPCAKDPVRGDYSKYGYEYLGLPNAAFSRPMGSGPAGTISWTDRIEYHKARVNSGYLNGGLFVANAEGTYNFVGEFNDPYSGELKKCNATITITDTATVTTPTENTESRKCVKAMNKLAALKEADASKKKIRKAKKARTAACRA